MEAVISTGLLHGKVCGAKGVLMSFRISTDTTIALCCEGCTSMVFSWTNNLVGNVVWAMENLHQKAVGSSLPFYVFFLKHKCLGSLV